MVTSGKMRWALLVCGCVGLLGGACGYFDSHNISVLNNDLIVAAGGGSAEVLFLGLDGQNITISLVAHKTSMIPFATLQTPGGGQIAAPPVSSATNGTNTITVGLTESGTYRLVVEDNSGQGGTITVRVER